MYVYIYIYIYREMILRKEYLPCGNPFLIVPKVSAHFVGSRAEKQKQCSLFAQYAHVVSGEYSFGEATWLHSFRNGGRASGFLFLVKSTHIEKSGLKSGFCFFAFSFFCFLHCCLCQRLDD